MKNWPREKEMDLQKKIDKNVFNWRMIYQLFSGLLFMTLGCVIFIKSKGYINFLNAGLFGSLMVAFGVYRIIVFINRLRKAKTEQK